MNLAHEQLCASPGWADYLAADLVPWGLDGVDLGPYALELGAGYGAGTAVLRGMVGRLTVLEVDAERARDLSARFTDARVTVLRADATAVPLPDAGLTSVVCFTMLHHVAPAAAQDALFAEARRVLAPGGLFAGTDSCPRDDLRDFHRDDVYCPVDPGMLPGRLRAAGFAAATVDDRDGTMRFRARR